MNQKLCNLCRKFKPLDAFYSQRRQCKPCHNKERIKRKHRVREPDGSRGIACPDCKTPGRGYCNSCASERSIAAKHKIPVTQYRRMLQDQKGLCFICDSKATDLDHNHKTGKIRRFLCHTCNINVGHHENGVTRTPDPKIYNYLKTEQ